MTEHMTPAEITDAVLDQARDDRRVDWEETEPDVVERVEDLDIPVVEIVWDAAWSSAVDACATAGNGTAAARIAELEQLASDILATYTKRDDGYRGRVGQVQIAKWRKVLDGTSPAVTSEGTT